LPILGPKALNDLQVALGQNTWLEELIARFDEIVLPDCWLVAGCIAQSIWNLSFGQPAGFGLKDIDVIYSDPRFFRRNRGQSRETSP
jgi:uncharacterized protein